jgi:hypothetical protein
VHEDVPLVLGDAQDASAQLGWCDTAFDGLDEQCVRIIVHLLHLHRQCRLVSISITITITITITTITITIAINHTGGV